MKNRTRAITFGISALLGLSAAGFGFSRWSSDLNLAGNVSAHGNWDVRIESAAVKSWSTGAAIDGTAQEVAPVYEFTVYDLYAVTVDQEKYPYVGDVYRIQVDDTNPHTVAMTLEEAQAYKTRLNIENAQPKGYSFFKSGILGPNSNKSAAVVYAVFNEAGTGLGYSGASGLAVDNTDNGACDQMLIGTCIVNNLYRQSVNPWNLVVSYEQGTSWLKTAEPSVIYPAEIAENGQSALLPNASLNLPGAWAQYDLTIRNNGTAAANLSAYSIVLEEDAEIFTLNTPEIGEDEVLAPGESCTLTFNVLVSEDAPEVLDADSVLKVSLQYEQDAVEEAPAPGHIHQ